MMTEALKRAIELAGGPRAVARLYDPPISSQAVSQWRICPPTRVRLLAQATGGQVTAAELRPDLFGTQQSAMAIAD